MGDRVGDRSVLRGSFGTRVHTTTVRIPGQRVYLGKAKGCGSHMTAAGRVITWRLSYPPRFAMRMVPCSLAGDMQRVWQGQAAWMRPKPAL